MAHTKLSASPRFPDDDLTNTFSFGLSNTSLFQILNKPYCSLDLNRTRYIEPFQLQKYVVISGKSWKAIKQITKNQL